MGGFAARKALSVVAHVEMVLAIESLTCGPALDYYRLLKTTPPLEHVYALVRAQVPKISRDRAMITNMEFAARCIRSGTLVQALEAVNA